MVSLYLATFRQQLELFPAYLCLSSSWQAEISCQNQMPGLLVFSKNWSIELVISIIDAIPLNKEFPTLPSRQSIMGHRYKKQSFGMQENFGM